MERIKDFLYRENDIIVVLVILACAALLIFTRINMIMEYPEKAAAQNAIETAQESKAADSAEEGEAADDASGGTEDAKAEDAAEQ